MKFLQRKKVNNSYYPLKIVSLDSNKLGYWYNVRVIAQGPYIEVYVDGTRYIRVYDSSFTSDKVGIRTDNIQAYFDDFEVWSF